MPTTLCSRNEGCANHLKHLCVKTLRPNVHDGRLVWVIQHLGFLQAEASQSHSWLRLEGTSGGWLPKQAAQERVQTAFLYSSKNGHRTACLAGQLVPVLSHPHEKLMSCTGKKLRVASVQHFSSMLSVSLLGCPRREGAVALFLC